MNQIFHDIPDYSRVNRAVQTQCCVLFSVDPSISRHIQSDLLAHHSAVLHKGARADCTKHFSRCQVS